MISDFNDTVELLVDKVQSNSGKRRVGGKELHKLTCSVSLLVADAMGILQTGKAWASVHRNTNWYCNNHNPDITARIHVDRAFDTLVDLGYLRIVKKGYSFGTKAGKPTRYIGTPKLHNLFPQNLDTIPALLPPTQRGELVRIQITVDSGKKDKQGKPIKETVKVDYADTAYSTDTRNRLTKINNLLGKHWIDLDITEEQYAALEKSLKQKSKESKHPDTVNLSHRSLYRVYNAADFKKGGRFYGGWWQGIPSQYRAYITIDSKPTVEYDYSGLHPAMLYAKEGKPAPDKPYEAIIAKLPNIVGVDVVALRKACKRCFNAMLNAEKYMTRSPKGLKLSEFNGLTWKQMKDAIKEVHAPINKYFFTGVGSELQRIDGDMAEEVMLHFASYGSPAPVLPVHDSFIMHHGYEKELREAMNAAFKKRFKIDAGLDMKSRAPKPKPIDVEDVGALLQENSRPCYLRFEAFEAARK